MRRERRMRREKTGKYINEERKKKKEMEKQDSKKMSVYYLYIHNVKKKT